MKNEAVFVTKILVPRTGPEIIMRSRLLDRLRDSNRRALTVLRAPAGYGKTTILVDLAHEAPGPVSWLSLDEWDRDLASFLQYLRLSITRQLHSLGVKVRPTAVHSEPRGSVADLLSRLGALDVPAWIVLDDFHSVDAANDVTALVDYAAQRLPPNCRLFLASRTRPPLACLPRLRLQGDVLEIGPEELAFSADEIKQYYQVVRGTAVPAEELERISSRTQGWPAGVALLQSGGDDDEQVSGAALSDYLAAEVFGRLPEEASQFLLRTSVLDTLEAGLCEAVLEERGSARRLASLEHQNVPLLRVQGAALEYRLHPLLRDFLREALAREQPEELRRLHRRAGEQLAARGQANEAVWHFAQAREWNEAAAIIEREAPSAYKLGRWQLIISWLRLVPALELQQRPALKAWEARILVRLGQPGEALRSINDALSVWSGEVVVSAEFETLRAAAFRIKGDVAAAVAAAERAVELAVRGNAPIELTAEARKERGLALMNAGRLPDAVADLRAALEVRELQGEEEEVAFLSGCLGSVLGSSSRLAESATYLNQARQYWQRIGNAKELSWILNNLAMVHTIMGQFEQGVDLFAQSLAKAREGGNQRMEAYALVSLGDVELRRARIASALRLYNEALELCAQLGEMTLSTHAVLGKAHARRLQGELLEAEALVRQALASAEQRGSALEEGLCRTALGRVFRQQGRFDDAVAELNAAAEQLEAVGATRELGVTLFYLADACLPVRSNRALLKLTLERLARVVAELGYHHFLLQAAEDAPRVPEYGVARRIASSLFRELLATSRAATPRSGLRRRHSGTVSMPAVDVLALGGFETRMDGRMILAIEWESEKAKELFLLLLTMGRPLTRDEIIASLWPEAGGKRASSAFHSTLHRARRALYAECIVESGSSYFVTPQAHVTYDVRQFRSLTDNRETDTPSDRIHDLSACVELYRGAFAPTLDSEWAQEVRMDLEGRFLHVAAQLADTFIAEGKHAQAAKVQEAILRIEPYNETACCKLMHALSAAGDLDGALRVYRRQCELLDFDLGERPGPSIQRLHSQIRSRLARAMARLS